VLALLMALAVGVLLSGVESWTGLWMALVCKTLGVSLAYCLVLFVAERRMLRTYGKWLSRAVARLGFRKHGHRAAQVEERARTL
jgi:hypothetical protein